MVTRRPAVNALKEHKSRTKVNSIGLGSAILSPVGRVPVPAGATNFRIRAPFADGRAKNVFAKKPFKY